MRGGTRRRRGRCRSSAPARPRGEAPRRAASRTAPARRVRPMRRAIPAIARTEIASATSCGSAMNRSPPDQSIVARIADLRAGRVPVESRVARVLDVPHRLLLLPEGRARQVVRERVPFERRRQEGEAEDVDAADRDDCREYRERRVAKLARDSAAVARRAGGRGRARFPPHDHGDDEDERLGSQQRPARERVRQRQSEHDTFERDPRDESAREQVGDRAAGLQAGGDERARRPEKAHAKEEQEQSRDRQGPPRIPPAAARPAGPRGTIAPCASSRSPGGGSPTTPAAS